MTDTKVETATEPSEQEEEDRLWEAAAGGSGETPDSATRDVLGLVHQVIDRFPEMAGKYRRYAGPAAVVSGALIALAGIAVARRVRQGQRPEHILQELTPDEIESAAKVAHQEHRRSRPRPIRAPRWRRFRREAGEPAPEVAAAGSGDEQKVSPQE